MVSLVMSYSEVVVTKLKAIVTTTGYCARCRKFRYLIDAHCDSCALSLGLILPEQVTKPVFTSTVKTPHSSKAKREKGDKGSTDGTVRQRRSKTNKEQAAQDLADEKALAAILPDLKSGDSWYQEAVILLNSVEPKPEPLWDKGRVMYTYRRLKRQGMKKQTTMELLYSTLTTTPQTVGEIAGKTFLDYEWVYQSLIKLAKNDPRVKQAYSSVKNRRLFYI